MADVDARARHALAANAKPEAFPRTLPCENRYA